MQSSYVAYFALRIHVITSSACHLTTLRFSDEQFLKEKQQKHDRTGSHIVQQHDIFFDSKPRFHKLLCLLSVTEKLSSSFLCVLSFDEFERNVVHDFFEHGWRDERRAVARKERINATVNSFPLKQPAIERASWSRDPWQFENRQLSLFGFY